MRDLAEQVKAAHNIADIIGEKVELKRSGNNTLKGLCPFHTEKTASFNVNEAKQIYHCFGCGEGGDVIKFVMKSEQIDFGDAVRRLAEKAGIQIEDRQGNGKIGRLFAMNKAAASFYQECLKKSERAMAYFTVERGLTPESIERFHLGCTNGSAVVDVLKKEGFTDEEIVEGSLGRKMDGQLLDYFWRRIIFPIVQGGRVKGFGGRLVADGDPKYTKYLNSQDTPVFHKKEILYGMDRTAVREAGFAIVVEGYLDVIMCHQHGFRNTVSPLGTAFGADHVKLLKKYTDTVYTVFDGDTAGRRAAKVTAKMMFDEQIHGGAILLPEGEDPDSFLRKGGDLSPLIHGAVPFAVYLSKEDRLSRRMIFRTLLGRPQVEVAEFLGHCGTPEERQAYEEMICRDLMREACGQAPIVLRKNDIEVRNKGGILVVFVDSQPDGKRIVRWARVKADPKKEAQALWKEVHGQLKKVAEEKEEA